MPQEGPDTPKLTMYMNDLLSADEARHLKQIGITWIGHASFLIQAGGENLLIDPNWANWLKVIKRMRHPGVDLHHLPNIDLVLVTHAHFDHLDRRTLREVANGRPVPEDGYAGPYIDEIARTVVANNPGLLKRSDAEQQEVFHHDGVELMFDEIRTSLAEFGVVFDVYFNERELHDSGAMDVALKRLRDGGHPGRLAGPRHPRRRKHP